MKWAIRRGNVEPHCVRPHDHVLGVTALRAPPGDHAEAACRIEHLCGRGREAVAGQHLFGRALRHLRKHRPAAGQSNARRPRQVKDVVVGQEHAEHRGAADDRETAMRQLERRPRLRERGACRIPEQGHLVRGIGCQRRNEPGQDQPPAQMRMRLLLVRVGAMHHRFDAVEPEREEALVGLELELFRHDAGRIGDHAVARNDGITLDAAGAF